MSRLTIKQAALGTLITIALACAAQLQLPASALADTAATTTTTVSDDATSSDNAAVAAAQAGVGYLAANQNADGSVSGSPGATEWSTIAVEASGQDASNFATASGTSAVDFVATDTPAPAAPATDVERNAIAIASTGADTTDFGGVNYDATLASYHTDSQIGDPTLLNDDIFGVIAADATQDPALRPEAQDGLNYFLAHQGADGGFSYTTDSCAFCGSDSNDTAAAIIAMDAAQAMRLSNPNLAASQTSALDYLLSTQQPDGGFAYDAFSPSDGSSTAWGLMALNSVGETVQTQALAARNWLLADQNPDGGFSFGAFGITASDTYTTAHAIIALLGTTWLLRPSPLHASQVGGRGSGQVSGDENVSPSLPAVTLASVVTYPSANNSYAFSAPASTQAPSGTETQPIHKAAKTPDMTVKPGPRYALYGLLALGLIALLWYVLQSRLKQGEA